MMDDEREASNSSRDDDKEATLAAIRRGWEDVQAGRTIPMQDFLKELKRRYGTSDSTR